MWFIDEGGWGVCSPIKRYWLARLLFTALCWCDYQDRHDLRKRDGDGDGSGLQPQRLKRRTCRPLEYNSLTLSTRRDLLNFRQLNYRQRIECWTKILVAAYHGEEYRCPPTLMLESCIFAILQINLELALAETDEECSFIWKHDTTGKHKMEVPEQYFQSRQTLLKCYLEISGLDFPISIEDLCDCKLTLTEIRQLVKIAGKQKDPDYNWVFQKHINKDILENRVRLDDLTCTLLSEHSIPQTEIGRLGDKYFYLPLSKMERHPYRWMELGDNLIDFYVEDRDFESSEGFSPPGYRIYNIREYAIEEGIQSQKPTMLHPFFEESYQTCLPLLVRFLSWILTHPPNEPVPPHSEFAQAVHDVPVQSSFCRQLMMQEPLTVRLKLYEIFRSSTFQFYIPDTEVSKLKA